MFFFAFPGATNMNITIKCLLDSLLAGAVYILAISGKSSSVGSKIPAFY